METSVTAKPSGFLQKAIPYALSIGASLAVGALSAVLTKDRMNIFDELVAPRFTPPAWVFPVVWTALYILMGIGMGIVWSKKDENPKAAKDALAYFGMNLFVNFSWSILFFNFRALWVSVFWLGLLLLIVWKMTVAFSKVDRVAAWLQAPYLVWLCIAGYLATSTAILN